MHFCPKTIAIFPQKLYNINMFNFVCKGLDISHKLDGQTLPSSDFKKHMHDHYEILYFVRGNITYTIEDKSKKLIPGELLFIPPAMLHFGTVDLTVPYERYVIKFDANTVSPELLRRVSNCANFFGRLEDLNIVRLLDDIYTNYSDDEERYPLMMAILASLLIHMYKTNSSAPSEQIYKNDVISDVVNYINANIRLPLTLNNICSELHFSKSYISKEFSQEMNTPIMTYIKYKKIIAAHKEIISTGAKAVDIAFKYGFKDYSTFYRNYVKVVGYPPKERK